MVIYSTTRDKPVLGEIVKMGLCQMLTKGHSVYRGRPKNSSSCVSVEKTPNIACQWNTRLKPPAQTPIFSVRTPPLDISLLFRAFYLILLWYYTGWDGVVN